MRLLLCGLLVLALARSAPSADKTKEEKTRYLRPTPKGFVLEAAFTLERDSAGWHLVSVTGRGDHHLTVRARYDGFDQLTAAEAMLTKGAKKTAAAVTVAAGKAKVQRPGQPAQEFAVPKGVIVTSAPDWTDIFLLCRRYDRKQGGKQTFAGLWIHPVQAAQLLKFTIERTGTDTIERDGKTLKMDRYLIRIRGPNPYLAWADDRGTLVKHLALPYKEGTTGGLVLEGYEKAAAGLRPAAKP